MKPLIWPLFLYSSCAYVHHIQIDDRESFQKEHFEIKVSEIGVHLGETASIT
jgi:hypothetical protein